MSELSPRARALFDAARKSGAPSAAEKAALLSRLEKTLAPPSLPPTAPATSLISVGSSVATLVVSSLLIAVWLGRGDGEDAPRTRDATPLAVEVRAPGPETSMRGRVSDVRAEPPGGAAIRETATEEATILQATHREATERSAAAPHTEGREPASPDRARRVRASDGASGVDPSAELALLRAAQLARREHRFEAAISALDEHAARFPRGLLAQERQVTRALVLCESGALEQGRALAAPFRTSAWSSALERACGAASALEAARGEENDENP